MQVGAQNENLRVCRVFFNIPGTFFRMKRKCVLDEPNEGTFLSTLIIYTIQALKFTFQNKSFKETKIKEEEMQNIKVTIISII